MNFSQVDYDRKRYGAALALQYENNAKNLQLTLHGIDSRYENPWLERSANISWPTGAGFGTPVWSPFASPAWRPIDGISASAPNGMLESGGSGSPRDVAGSTKATNAANINHGSAVPGLPFVNDCDSLRRHTDA